MNDSLELPTLTYEGSAQYENGPTTVTGSPQIQFLTIVPKDVGPNYVIGLRTLPHWNFTWRFAGGPYYPTLNLHYRTGQDLTHTFTDAPIVIGASQPEITNDTVDEKILNWTIGVGIIAAIVAIVEIHRLSSKER